MSAVHGSHSEGRSGPARSRTTVSSFRRANGALSTVPWELQRWRTGLEGPLNGCEGLCAEPEAISRSEREAWWGVVWSNTCPSILLNRSSFFDVSANKGGNPRRSQLPKPTGRAGGKWFAEIENFLKILPNNVRLKCCHQLPFISCVLGCTNKIVQSATKDSTRNMLSKSSLTVSPFSELLSPQSFYLNSHASSAKVVL